MKVNIDDNKKICTECLQEKPLSDYFKNKASNDGYTTKCRVCIKRRVKTYSLTGGGRKSHREASRRHYSTLRGRLGCCYKNIVRRCTNPKAAAWSNYGNRGIHCNFATFEEFYKYVIKDLGYDTYAKIEGLEIDRVDNSGNYEPNNIRFIPPKVNCNNRRKTVLPGNHSAKLNESDVLEIRRLHKMGKYPQQQLAEKYSISRENISMIVARKTWKYI